MPLPPAARVLLAAILLVLVVAVTRPAPAAGGTTRSEARLLHVINNARANHGLRRLRIRSTLQTSSHAWARYLRTHGAFYHGRISPGTAENIGWLTCQRHWARSLVRMWLRSPSHRPHLLDRSARRIGVGMSRGRWSGYGCVWMSVTRFR